MEVFELLTDDGKRHLVGAIAEAEKNTSGEIRVHIESVCKGDPYMRAAYVFAKLDMFNTKERNGILIYLATKSRKFAIVGDSGINEKVGPDYWTSVKQDMEQDFKAGLFIEGMEKAILSVGNKLKNYFPYQSDDVNELSDEISVGE